MSEAMLFDMRGRSRLSAGLGAEDEMQTTGTTGLGSKALTLDDVLAAADKLKALPKPSTEWIVISPDGVMYRGEVQEVMRPLLAAHPLMKPLSLSDILTPNVEHERLRSSPLDGPVGPQEQ